MRRGPNQELLTNSIRSAMHASDSFLGAEAQIEAIADALHLEAKAFEEEGLHTRAAKLAKAAEALR